MMEFPSVSYFSMMQLHKLLDFLLNVQNHLRLCIEFLVQVVVSGLSSVHLLEDAVLVLEIVVHHNILHVAAGFEQLHVVCGVDVADFLLKVEERFFDVVFLVVDEQVQRRFEALNLL